MLVNHDREKLINAIIFFAKNTKNLGKTKLFKLLYFLDFEHFKMTGRSVTGLDYFAWPKGPVPKTLFDEVDNPQDDIKAKVELSWKSIGNGKRMLDIRPLVEFENKFFSKRELTIMTRLAEEFKSKNAEAMVEATHLENEPWDNIFNVQGLKQSQIPYELAIRRQEKEEVLHMAAYRKALVDHFSKK